MTDGLRRTAFTRQSQAARGAHGVPLRRRRGGCDGLLAVSGVDQRPCRRFGAVRAVGTRSQRAAALRLQPRALDCARPPTAGRYSAALEETQGGVPEFVNPK
jgi:hypothetical protein